MERDEYPGAEKRRFSRLKDNIFALCHLSSDSGVEEFKVITEDISAGGLMFETEISIPQESRLNLEIYQPVNRDKTMIFCIPVFTKVAWVREIDKDNFESGENRYRAGIEFLEIKEEDKNRILEYIIRKGIRER